MKHNFTFSFLIILLFFYVSSFAQSQSVTGVVKDDTTGETLPGASVTIAGTSNGTVTDTNGKFIIKVSSLNDKLQVSFLGFVSQTISISGRTNIEINLKPNYSALDEVVVIGYGEQKKETLVGAISTVSSKELVQSPVANISNSLAGRLPGLVVVQRSGEPGRDQSTLKIRGIGTLSQGQESDPLIMIDGVPREVGTGGQGALNNLDPNEIETITVLKDASATAVFGVRGANGVILVTTKSGKMGKPNVSFSSNVGLQTPTLLPEYLGSADYAFLQNEGIRNDAALNGIPYVPKFSDEDIRKFRDQSDPIGYPSRIWMNEFIKSASPQQQYNLNISGGLKSVKYFVSAGYFSQEGIYNTDDFDFGFNSNPGLKRYNFRSNFDIDFTKKFKAAIKLGTQSVNTTYPGLFSTNLFFNMLQKVPFTGPGIVDGKIITQYVNDPLGSYGYPSRGYSPYGDLASSGYQTNSENNLNLSLELKHDLDFITKGLIVRGLLAFDNTFLQTINRGRSIDTYTINPDGNGGGQTFKNSDLGNFTFGESYGKFRRNYLETSFNYARKFGNHNVTALALYQQETRWSPFFQFNVPKNNLGLVSRITYDYKAKYLADFSMGYNGSENFPDNKRYGFFPAFGLGWVVTQENFLADNKILNRLKIRGSYGEVGNDKIGGDRFLYLPSVFRFTSGGASGYNFGRNGIDRNFYRGSQEDKLGNPNVTWERSIKSNIGFEAEFLKNRLTFTADYFRENRDNILVNLGTVPALVAASLPAANIGKVKNRGFELDGKWRDSKGDFSYFIGVNMAFARNKILFRDEPTPLYPWLGQTGFSVGQFKATRNAGFYNTPQEVANRPYYSFYGNNVTSGDLKYIDIDGDGLINQNDEVPVGYNNFPEITFGLPLGFSYKGFDFSILLQGASNNYAAFREFSGWAFAVSSSSTLAIHRERWSEERYANGEKITQPRLSFNGTTSANSINTDFWMHDQTYLRLRNVEVGYRIALNKLGIKSIRTYVNGNNLLTFTGYKQMDPEKSSGRDFIYPQMSVFNAGFNVQF